MKITESKLRQMIRGVIREFVSTGTAAGAQKGDYESPDTKSKETTYNTKSTKYDTKNWLTVNNRYFNIFQTMIPDQLQKTYL